MKLKNAGTGHVVDYPAAKELKGQALASTKGLWAPRILVFDIETTPMLSHHWRCYKENISPVQVVNYSKLLCWSAKWVDGKMVYFDSTQKDKDDKRCCGTMRELCDEADILVAHNGRAFDMGTLKARWIAHGFDPPSPSKWVDTLRVCRHQLNLASNKLDAIARYFNLGTKHPHEGFQLWLDCMGGKKKAWQTMQEYNIQDVLLEEELYLLIRAWDSKHPNVQLMYDDEEERCVCCGHRTLTLMARPARTNASEFSSYRCSKCRKIMRCRKRDPGNQATFANVL